ncbi:MAG: hypothetical protein ACR2P5_00555 [Gammaproteobacteria bacterium]
MAKQPHRTLDDLRARLRRRLGFAHTGSVSLVNNDLLTEFLQDAQESLWDQFDIPELFVDPEIQTARGAFLYDFPDDCDPTRIYEISANVTQYWRPLDQGIDTRHDTVRELEGYPVRWDVTNSGQLELYPFPDQIYRLKLEYLRKPGPFSEDHDRASFDDRLIFLYALATAKAHYRMPDAQAIGNQLQARISTLRARAKMNYQYNRLESNRRARRAETVMVRPRMVT